MFCFVWVSKIGEFIGVIRQNQVVLVCDDISCCVQFNLLLVRYNENLLGDVVWFVMYVFLFIGSESVV